MNAGMVAYYVATKGKHPFGPEAYRLQNMLEGKPVGLEEIKDVQLKDLLSWMLQRQPGNRPSADKALKHPYLQSDEEKINMLCDMGNQLEVKHSQVFLKDGLDMEENEDVAQNQLDDMNRFRRFLVLGSETPTFYVDEKTLGLENKRVFSNLLQAGRGVEVVNEIEKYSIEGRTARKQAIVFSLAVCARKGDLATKRQAYKALTKICQISTHLFMFIEFCKVLSKPGKGWGRAQRNAIKRWYKEKDPWKLAMDLTKYQKVKGWSHRDVARLIHLKPEETDVSDELFVIMKYVVHAWQKLFEYFFPEDKTTPHRPIGENSIAMLEFFRAVEEVKTLQKEARMVELINQHNLIREHIPTRWFNSKEVWNSLLKKMPMTAMIRNLNKMTSIGLLAEGSPQVKDVCNKLQNENLLRIARIHPFNMLLALTTYKSGKGEKGSLEWQANVEIAKALEKAFYLSFKNVEPTGKSYMLAMDVSGSMQFSRCIGASTIKPHVASAAMAMMTARTEERHEFVAFSHEIVPMEISSNMNLDEVLNVANNIPMGNADCTQPMLYATNNKLKIDVFIVYTDSETYYGDVTPREALKQYRKHSGIYNAKLIVVAMASNGFTIADPDDPGMLDIAGFDSAAPQVMKEFILGNL
ncbi:60 kDa SS-A/Ro ribonucleoprotein-like [Xenia sp. Carnegie-2017]|uniref:60 kDa SS-A/Ro ribonucleoprotein-like n=1 Tax=Xenia sp. Carnegie-2017 TaxID=2897299 RepID=UPI001F041B33|nr:60 kDa SS-A/Ro ribonucleoprotein-like [Xenia sp. Carnegie-2017]